MAAGKLGRIPEDRSKPKLQLRDFIDTGNLPAYPLVDIAPAVDYPMDHNDTVGCCVVAGVDHYLKLAHTLLTGSYDQPSDDELLRWYQTQNPGFASWTDAGGPHDNGMIVADFLAWLVKQGVILGFAKVDHTNEAEILAAVYLFLGIITGEDVRAAQMTSEVWDYTPKSPDAGGHCTVTHVYDQPQGRLGLITWGSGSYQMTTRYLQYGVEEAYVVITQAHVDHPGFRDNFDLPRFAAAYKEITGRDFPIAVPPAPVPTPTPTPPNPDVPQADRDLAAAIPARWLTSRHVGDNAKVQAALIAWKQATGL